MTDKQKFLDGLKELGDESYQKRVWCGGGGAEMSSFTEAVCTLFDDSGLAIALEKQHRILFSLKLDEDIRKLRSVIKSIDGFKSQEEIVEDPKMKTVRILAKQIFHNLTKLENGERQ
jgi:hypothetical protein